MLLLALLPISRNPYEAQATPTVRRYLLRVTAPAVVAALALLLFGYGLHVVGTPLYVVLTLLVMVVVMFAVSHLIRLWYQYDDTDGELVDLKLTRYASKLTELNNLKPVSVCLVPDNRAQAIMHEREPSRIVVTTALEVRTDDIGMIGILGHELAHRELPLGTGFPKLLQTCVHSIPDYLLRRLNKRVGRASQEFIELQRVMDPREATRRMVELSMLHALSKLCWHMSSSPALRLRELACDAIAVCIVRNPYPLIHGLISLRTPQLATYPYMLDSHPQVGERIDALLAIERNIICTP